MTRARARVGFVAVIATLLALLCGWRVALASDDALLAAIAGLLAMTIVGGAVSSVYAARRTRRAVHQVAALERRLADARREARAAHKKLISLGKEVERLRGDVDRVRVPVAVAAAALDDLRRRANS